MLFYINKYIDSFFLWVKSVAPSTTGRDSNSSWDFLLSALLDHETDLKSHMLGTSSSNSKSPGRAAAYMLKTPTRDLGHELLSHPPFFHQQRLLLPTIIWLLSLPVTASVHLPWENVVSITDKIIQSYLMCTILEPQPNCISQQEEVQMCLAFWCGLLPTFHNRTVVS